MWRVGHADGVEAPFDRVTQDCIGLRRLQAAASVIITASMVAMLGAIIAAPFATPLTRSTSAAANPTAEPRSQRLGETCPFVIIAVAASQKLSGDGERRPAAEGIPAASFSRGRKRPITPVEQTSTSSGEQSSRFATSAVIHRASSSPRVPVQALALPELTITARAVARGKRERETFTGAPHTRLVVKTPTAVDGLSAANSARSSFEDPGLMPQATPAARKPAGSGMDVAKKTTPEFRKWWKTVRSYNARRH